ncbi:MAG TPA: 2-phospho-L-lactate guanylyltransferase [Nitrosopumilaceae archaeon]|nr:2-phospho-L-lactate guanylyltransferase [Nitrosopumilaceae archaeon]
MSKFRTAAIVPVKTFSKAKRRLNLSPEKREIICKLMLEEVLRTISKSDLIEKTALVTKDESAFSIGKRFGCIEIIDEKELGVNNAVAIADEYFKKNGYDATIVFPQDIPLMQPGDIKTLFNFKMSQKCALVVPSRKFDGTNALFRTPVNLMKTHYDEDSYKIHLSKAEEISASSALVLIRRIMLDVDELSDLQFVSQFFNQSNSKILQGL